MKRALTEKIIRLIKASGPVSVADFMHICMSDPKHGYYQTEPVFGDTGDFITAPEISQMFGELIGVWCIHTWMEMGRPARFNLVELGPGRGKLMADLLRAEKTVPEFAAAAKVHLLETSKALIAQQAEALESDEREIVWIDDLTSLSKAPMVLVANEFLDVLPVRQYVFQEGGWHERLVGIDATGHLAFCLSPNRLPRAPFTRAGDPPTQGAVFESSPAREAYVQQVCDRLKVAGGSALFIDYGHAKSGFGETLQAVRGHQFAQILDEPGSADLSSHVDFEALAAVAKGEQVQVAALRNQADFLMGLGLLERAGSLGAGQSKAIQARLTREVERLANPDQMGELFKVFHLSFPVNQVDDRQKDN